MIAETFRSEREGVLSDLRGQSRGRFLSDVLHWMAQAGLNDTALNRDAAAEATFRARANGLFASAGDLRKPSLNSVARPQAASSTEARCRSKRTRLPYEQAKVAVVGTARGTRCFRESDDADRNDQTVDVAELCGATIDHCCSLQSIRRRLLWVDKKLILGAHVTK